MDEPAQLKVIGRYSYYQSRCLGQGSFGKVFEGFENTTRQRVAIKKVDFKLFEKDSYLEQSIYSEIKILSRFKHPNIVELYEVLNSKRSLYLIMEFCQDGDLKKYLKQRGRLPEDECYEVVRQIAAGLRELHRQKVIHRDLKPANILIHGGRYKICDFGFSKYVESVGDALKSCVGSPIYMAPQILEKQNYSYKCDVWSLGIIYFELLHGSPPWRGINELDLLHNIKSIQLRCADCFNAKTVRLISGMLALPEDKRLSWEEVFAYFGFTAADSPQIKKQAMLTVNGGYPAPLTPSSSKSVTTNFSQGQPPQNLSPRQAQQSPRPITPVQQPAMTSDQLFYQHQLQQQQLRQQLYVQQQKALQLQQMANGGAPHITQQPHQPSPVLEQVPTQQPVIAVSPPSPSANVPVKPLTVHFFEELAFRSHVCLETASKLHLLHRHNFSKHLPDKFVLLLSSSIKFKYERHRAAIEQLQDQQAVGFAVYQYQHAVIFHEDLLFKLRASHAGEDFFKDPDLKRLLQGSPLASPQPYQQLLRFTTGKFAEELMEEVRVSDSESEIEVLLSLLDNICDMIAVNEEFQKTAEIHLQRLMRERGEYRIHGLEKSVSKVNSKLMLSKKASRCCYF